MGSSRFAGLGLAVALAASGAVMAPVVAAPAQAAVVSPVVVTASKPKIKTNLPVRKIVTVNKTASFKVKATGGSLKYQWYQVGTMGGLYTKVPGKAGKKATLKVKATAARTGMRYKVLVYNAKGKKVSRTSILLVRTTRAAAFKDGASTFTARYAMQSYSYNIDLGNGTTLINLGTYLNNYTSKAINPKGKLTFTFVAKNGAKYGNRNANGNFYIGTYWGANRKGVNTVGSVAGKSKATATFYSAVVVPNALATGGRWLVTDKSSPKMSIYLKQS